MSLTVPNLQTTLHLRPNVDDGTSIFQGKDADYHDFAGIIVLLLINSTISFMEENNAGNAAAALMARLAPKAKVSEQMMQLKYKPIFNLWLYCNSK